MRTYVKVKKMTRLMRMKKHLERNEAYWLVEANKIDAGQLQGLADANRFPQQSSCSGGWRSSHH